MRKKLIVSVTLMAFILSSVNLVYGKRSESLKDDDDLTETRVYLREQCLLSVDNKELIQDDAEPKALIAAVGAILLPLVIKSAIGGISSALNKAGSKQTKSDSGKRPTYLYKITNPDSTGAITGAHAKGATEINFDGVKSSKVFKKNDSFVIEGDDQRYVFLVDASADNTGKVVNASIAPALIAKVESGAVITINDPQGKLILNPNLGCVIAIRGKFKDPDDANKQSSIWVDKKAKKHGEFSKNTEAKNEQERIDRLNDSDIPIEKIAFVYEARIKRSTDNTAMLYESQYFQVNSFQGNRSQKKPRNVVISLAVFGAGTIEGSPTLSFAMMDLGRIKAKTIRGPKKLGSKFSGWVGGLGISTKALASIENLKTGNELMPATFHVTITEIEKGNQALRFIADVLEATKEDAANALSAEFLKDRKAEGEEEENAAEKLRLEEEAAYSACLEAIKKFEAGNPSTGSDLENFLKYEIRRAVRVWTSKKSLLEKAGLGVSGDASVCEEK